MKNLPVLCIRRRARISLRVVALMLLPAVAVAQDAHVSGPEALQKALAGNSGGTIVLAPGNYGDLKFDGRQFTALVTLRSEVPHKAVFGEIRLKNSANLGFDGLMTRAQFRADKSTDLHIANCLAKNMLYFRNVMRLDIRGCNVSGGTHGVVLNTVAHFGIRDSWIGKASEDLMRITGDSHHGLVEGNALYDVIAVPPTHPDLIQIFAAKGKTPYGITIRRNLLHDDHRTGPDRTAQGIFISDPSTGGYRDILIENNLINTRSPNTIFVKGGQRNVVIRNNTLIAGHGDGGAIIRIVGKAEFNNSGTTVEGNIAKLISDDTKGARIGENYLYGRDARLSAIFSGPGARWQDYQPVLGSEAERSGMGATGFLAALQAAQVAAGKAQAVQD